MRPSHPLQLAILAGLASAAVGALAFLSSGMDAEADLVYKAQLRELVRADTALNVDVLRAHDGVSNSYDAIAADERRLAELEPTLAPPSYLARRDRDDMRAALDRLHAALTEQRDRVASFEAKNSALSNSVRYVPTLARDLSADDGVADILARLLAWQAAPDTQAGALLQHDVAALDDAAAGVSSSLTLLARHMQVVLATKPLVDGLVGSIVDSQVDRRAREVQQEYDEGFDDLERRQNILRAGLYAACALLALAVSSMVMRVRRAAAHLRVANTTLEERVAERTKALDGRTTQMRLVLDNAQQGLVVADARGVLDDERSAYLRRFMAPGEAAPRTVFELVQSIDVDAAAWLEVAWPDLFEGVLPFEVVVDQLPQRLRAGSSTYAMQLQPIGDKRVLLILSDITDRIARERAEADGRDVLALLDLLRTDRARVVELVDECDALVARATAKTATRQSRLRDLHTLKGSVALVGMGSLSQLCHDLEGIITEAHTSEADALRPLAETWTRLRASVASVATPDGRIELTAREHQALLHDADHLSRRELLARLERLADEPAEQRLQRFADQTRALALRLDKSIDVVIDGGGVRFDRARLQPLWAVLPHALRNAVDHGVEPVAARIAAHKLERARITLMAKPLGDDVLITIADDGAGVDWPAVQRRAVSMGLPASTDAELHDALFFDRLSTRVEVTETSGRGVGLAALRAAVVELRGTIAVDSAPSGTTFRIVIPSASAASESTRGRAPTAQQPAHAAAT
ncbi:MAG TPA: DAHL domain-containing protein [Myxococcota bacterium]